MNKLGMVLGAAAIATLAGCKDPDYKYDTDPASQNDVKVVGDAQPAEVKPAEISAVEPASAQPVVAQPVATQPVAAQPVVVPADISQPSASSAAKPVAAAATTVYVVKNGDSLSKIAKNRGVSLSALRSANPSLKGDKIRIGQKLNIPAKASASAATAAAAKSAAAAGATKTYVVKSGDTLGAIAIANGISVRQLKELNGLTKDTIRIGQKLKVPAVKGAATTAKKTVAKKTADAKKAAEPKAAAPKVADKAAPVAAPAAQPAPAPAESATQPAPAPEAPAEQPAPVEQPAEAPAEQPAAVPAAADAAPSSGATYVVQEGDDMTGISIRWGVSAAAIRELNNLGENDQLKVGQVIKLPADAQQ